MQLFDSAAVRDLLKPPPGAHDWSVHEVGDPGSGRLVRHCSRCGVEQPYPADREAPPCAPRGRAPGKPPATAAAAGLGHGVEPGPRSGRGRSPRSVKWRASSRHPSRPQAGLTRRASVGQPVLWVGE